jgi:predicted ATP-grasp superfamily ATP-dependent carboligase
MSSSNSNFNSSKLNMLKKASDSNNTLKHKLIKASSSSIIMEQNKFLKNNFDSNPSLYKSISRKIIHAENQSTASHLNETMQIQSEFMRKLSYNNIL